MVCDHEYSPWTSSKEEEARPHTPISRCVTNAHYTCELFKIVSEVLDEVYAPRMGWTKSEREDRVTQTHLELVAFYDRFPSFLKISPSSQKPALPHIYQLHLQYHVAMILLHRPFLKALRRDEAISGNASGEDDVHSRACRASADWISNIFRIYRANYTLRRIPISAVHCAFTAAIIHLVDATSCDDVLRKKALRRLHTCLVSLHEMSTAWAWSKRSILALHLLAKEWNVDDKILGRDAPSTEDLERSVESIGETVAEPDGEGGLELSPEHDETLDTNWLFEEIFGHSTDPTLDPLASSHYDMHLTSFDEIG